MIDATIGRPCPMKDCDGYMKRLDADITITEYDYMHIRGSNVPPEVIGDHALIGEPGQRVYHGQFTRCEKCGFGAFQLNAPVAGPKG